MLNKERIRHMTRLAAYEQGEGKEYIPICQYHRKDYVGLQMLKSFIYSTIAFVILLLLQIFYHIENLQEILYQTDFKKDIFNIVLAYVLFVIVYQIIAWVIYSLRYRRAQKKNKIYLSRLKKVEKLYEGEEGILPSDE